ncbi:class I SAM-dependent methyltransferase [Candidatus Woesearchaeota archaeon]|jgi:ubiquinone/menaquinone biosynthesis C-methylase UbiE|nr:class I SAM-dependent methyltransferase [Candidatus Woesearchaeota archaeon]MBT7237512.1 class I SAM-dependent methyltransferase [Candidatus Woesearchaeota archaeon]
MDYYSKIAEGYNELHKSEQLDKVKTIFKNIYIPHEETVLDVGCGTALYGYLFRNYKGIDPSPGMLEQSRSDVRLGNAEEIPFEDNSFDNVISITAIHNFKDYKKGVEEMIRVAKKRVVITLLKKAKKFEEIKEYLKDFRQIEHETDLILEKNV